PDYALRFPAPEPSRNRQSLAPRGQNFVFVSIGEKTHQCPTYRQDIARLLSRRVKAQCATVGRRPRFIEIEDTRKKARVVVAKAVEMAAIERTRWVQRVMSLEGKEPD